MMEHRRATKQSGIEPTLRDLLVFRTTRETKGGNFPLVLCKFLACITDHCLSNILVMTIKLVNDTANVLLLETFDRRLHLLKGITEVIDTSGGCGASFAIEIVSVQFEGKKLLERHRLINSCLEEEMKEIHALSIKKALTPEQWKQQQESQVSKPAE
ncbi:hypothetical protein ACFX13_000054 [Malus domestica]